MFFFCCCCRLPIFLWKTSWRIIVYHHSWENFFPSIQRFMILHKARKLENQRLYWSIVFLFSLLCFLVWVWIWIYKSNVDGNNYNSSFKKTRLNSIIVGGVRSINTIDRSINQSSRIHTNPSINQSIWHIFFDHHIHSIILFVSTFVFQKENRWIIWILKWFF